MEISEQIVVVNEGRIEQSASPAEIYDEPATQFVMGFVGPVTRVGGAARAPARRPGAHRAGRGEPAGRRHADRAGSGFEVRVELLPAEGDALYAQLSRTEADQLELAEGQIVHVRVDPTRARREPRERLSSAACASPPRPTTPSARGARAGRRRPTSKPVKGERIATAQAIPLRFLENILMQLRHAGLVESRRGADGGYRLARPAAEVTLADVIRAIDGPLAGVSGARPGDARLRGRRRADARRLDRRARLAARRARARHAGRRRRRRAARARARAASADEDAWVPH